MSSNQRSSLCCSTDYNINNIFVLHSSMHKQCHIINFRSLHKNFQEDHLNSRRFPGFLGGFSNSRRFPGFQGFPGVVDTLTQLNSLRGSTLQRSAGRGLCEWQLVFCLFLFAQVKCCHDCKLLPAFSCCLDSSFHAYLLTRVGLETQSWTCRLSVIKFTIPKQWTWMYRALNIILIQSVRSTN